MLIRAATARKQIVKRSIASAIMQDWPVPRPAIVVIVVISKAIRREVKRSRKARTIREKNGMH